MKTRICFFLPIATGALAFLNGCCCPCDTNSRLLEDFWVSPEARIEWLQQHRGMSTVDGETIDVYNGWK